MIHTCLQCGKNLYANTEADLNGAAKAHVLECPNSNSGETRRQRSFHRERDLEPVASRADDASHLTQNGALIDLRKTAKGLGILKVSRMTEQALEGAIEFRSKQIEGGIEESDLLDFTATGNPITPKEIGDQLTAPRILEVLTNADVKITKRIRESKPEACEEMFKRKLYREVI